MNQEFWVSVRQVLYIDVDWGNDTKANSREESSLWFQSVFHNSLDVWQLFPRNWPPPIGIIYDQGSVCRISLYTDKRDDSPREELPFSDNC